MRILHIADIHADNNPKHQAKLRRSFDQILKHLTNTLVDYVVVPGDVWENLQNYKEDSGVKLIYYYFDIIAKLTKGIIIVKGNNNHDAIGSVELLHKPALNIYAYEYPLSLAFNATGKTIDLLRSDIATVNAFKPEIIFNMIPYPTKTMIVKDTSIDENNQNFNDVFNGLMELMGLTNNQFDCPKIMGFHGQVGGAKFANGQEQKVQDIIIPPSTLRKANCNYYALGHIHLPQLLFSDMGYSGSMYNKNYGETEQKYFFSITFKAAPYTPIVEQIKLIAVRPMVTVDAEFKDGKFVFEDKVPENAEVRFKYKISEDERNLITPDKLDEIVKRFGDDVQIDKDVVPIQRESRSAEIMQAETEEQEVEAYAKVVSYEMTKSIRAKIQGIETELVNGEVEEVLDEF